MCGSVYFRVLNPAHMVYRSDFYPGNSVLTALLFLLYCQRYNVSWDCCDYTGTLCFYLDFDSVFPVCLLAFTNASDIMIGNDESEDVVDLCTFDNITLCNLWE